MRVVFALLMLCALAPLATADEAARKQCAAAMNADPEFARAVIKEAERVIRVNVDTQQACKDGATIAAHEAAASEIATNKRHVIMAYIAMWLVAVAFVVFLWRRQQALKLEIVQLRKDLDAAANEGKATP